MYLEEIFEVVRKKGLPDINFVRFGFLDGFLCGSEITDELYVDGICFLPRKDVKKLVSDFPQSDVMRGFFRHLGKGFLDDVWVYSREFFSLTSVYEYFVDGGFVVGVHLEKKSLYEFYAGVILSFDSKFIKIRGIDPEGVFYKDFIFIRKNQITKIEHGTRYLRALNLAAFGR